MTSVDQIRAALRVEHRKLERLGKFNAALAEQRVCDLHNEIVDYHKNRIKFLEELLLEAQKKEERKVQKRQIQVRAAQVEYHESSNGELQGVTPSGKKWHAIRNQTNNENRRYLLIIAEVGLVFRTGSLNAVLRTVVQN